jgi:hypothetical protein
MINKNILIIISVIIVLTILWWVYFHNKQFDIKSFQPHNPLITYIILGSIIIVVVSIWWYRNNEHFDNNIMLPKNQLVPQLTEPTTYDPITGTIMTSPDFIPNYIEPAWSTKPSSDNQNIEKNNIMEFATNLGNDTMAFNRCSKACCSKQYPLPFHLPIDKDLQNNINDFVPSRFTCNNNWEDTGCLCMTKKQSDNLAERGNNN